MIKAFSYMFQDNKFIQKAACYFGFLLAANFLSLYAQTLTSQIGSGSLTLQYITCALFGLIIMIVPIGYNYLCIKSLMLQKDTCVLPFLNIGKTFLLGLKFFVNMIMLSLMVYGPFICLLILGGILASMGGKSVLAFVLCLLLLIYILLSFVFLILICIYTPALGCIFAKDEGLTAFCRFIKATKLIQEDAGTYFKGVGIYVLIMIAYAIIYGIFNFVTTILLGNTAVSALIMAVIFSTISTYLVFVYSYIVVKAVKHEMI